MSTPINPEELMDGLSKTKEAFQNIVSAKRKREIMSNTDNEKFQWSEDLAKEFARKFATEYFYLGLDNGLKAFVASHSKEQVEGKRDWIIESYLCNHLGCERLFNRISDSKYEFKHPQLGANTVHESELLVNNTTNIHSVRRLSDGMVFQLSHKHGNLTVTHWKIKDGKMYAHFAPAADRDVELSQLVAPERKEPVLFSHDKRPIYAGDTFWTSQPVSSFKAKEDDRGFWKEAKLFLSKQEAEDFWILNTPCLSVGDIMQYLEENKFGWHYSENEKKFKRLAAQKLKI